MPPLTCSLFTLRSFGRGQLQHCSSERCVFEEQRGHAWKLRRSTPLRKFAREALLSVPRRLSAAPSDTACEQGKAALHPSRHVRASTWSGAARTACVPAVATVRPRPKASSATAKTKARKKDCSVRRSGCQLPAHIVAHLHRGPWLAMQSQNLGRFSCRLRARQCNRPGCAGGSPAIVAWWCAPEATAGGTPQCVWGVVCCHGPRRRRGVGRFTHGVRVACSASATFC